MTQRALILLAAGLASVYGCANQPSGWEQSASGQVEPVLRVSRLAEDTYEVRCELRTREPSRNKEFSLEQRLVLHPEEPGQISLFSNRYLRFLLEATVTPTDQPNKVRVTYLLLMATPQGTRPWQGRNVEWTLGEARGLSQEPEITASALAQTK